MENIKEQLIQVIMEILGSDQGIDEETGFYDMGISSLTVLTFTERINEIYNIKCDEADLFNYPNIIELSGYIWLKLNK